jgi:transcriptional regulator GlxA family with amidase domain
VNAASAAELERLLEHMRVNAPFVDANLSVKKLARQISMPARDLSVLINNGLGQSFFEFVNAYRIDRAAEILGDHTRNQTSVLDVLYEVGFNSKSSFNTAFKRRLGHTPSAYRRMRMK